VHQREISFRRWWVFGDPSLTMPRMIDRLLRMEKRLMRRHQSQMSSSDLIANDNTFFGAWTSEEDWDSRDLVGEGEGAGTAHGDELSFDPKPNGFNYCQ